MLLICFFLSIIIVIRVIQFASYDERRGALYDDGNWKSTNDFFEYVLAIIVCGENCIRFNRNGFVLLNELFVFKL